MPYRAQNIVWRLPLLASVRRGARFPRLGVRALTFAVLMLMCSSLSCSRATQRGLTLAGSTSLQPYAENWADAYQSVRPSVQIHVQGGGSTSGVQAAISGAAQIGMSSRPLTASERRKVTGIAVARDGIALVVHPTRAARDLSLEQIRAIYAGELKNWRDIDGRVGAITVITREEGSGTRAAFEDLVMGGKRITAAALVQDSTGAVRQMVASDPAAIGYVSTGLLDASIIGLRLGGEEPSEANIDAGKYPLVRPFLFVVPAQPQAQASDFIAWITGPEGRALTRREGLLPPQPQPKE